MNRALKDFLRAILGPRGSWRLKRKSRRQSADFPARLKEALDRTSADIRSSSDRPVFILSAGWRSGSTLLQRMIMQHNDDILIWGEPYAHSNLFINMADQFRSFVSEWPMNGWFLSKTDAGSLSDKWVANLYPDVDYLLNAHRAYFACLFAEPARAFGRSNWGLKEVRLTIDHATYFRALYPECKLLLLCRDPRDAYLSYRRYAPWFRSWPDGLVCTPSEFGRLWAQTVRGFAAGCNRVDALLVRYEDLDDSTSVARIGKYLGWDVPRSSALHHRDFATSGTTREKLPKIDRVLLNLATAQLRKDMGYA